MSYTPTLARDPIARALSWIESRGIDVQPWPAPASAAPVDRSDHPVLYLVEPDAPAPRCGDLEDWVRCPLDLAELTARADRLIGWSRDLGASYTRVDEDDLLRVGDRVVVLSSLEARLMRRLVDSMEMLVLREDLIASVWPDGPPQDPRALDNRIKALRVRLADVPLQIHTVHGRGLLLSRTVDERTIVR